jgi:hypothetical protein
VWCECESREVGKAGKSLFSFLFLLNFMDRAKYRAQVAAAVSVSTVTLSFHRLAHLCRQSSHFGSKQEQEKSRFHNRFEMFQSRNEDFVSRKLILIHQNNWEYFLQETVNLKVTAGLGVSRIISDTRHTTRRYLLFVTDNTCLIGRKSIIFCYRIAAL